MSDTGIDPRGPRFAAAITSLRWASSACDPKATRGALERRGRRVGRSPTTDH